MLLTERYSKQISGVLHCYDRVIVQGTIPGICYAGGMTSYLNANKIRVFDYPTFAAPFKEQLRENAEKSLQIMESRFNLFQREIFEKKQ